MREKVCCVLAIGAAVLLMGCTVRRTADKLQSGLHGPGSPAGSAGFGAEAYNRPPYGPDESKVDAMHQTAGLTGRISNGKLDPTMQGSGNLAYQGYFSREERQQRQPQQQTSGVLPPAPNY